MHTRKLHMHTVQCICSTVCIAHCAMHTVHYTLCICSFTYVCVCSYEQLHMRATHAMRVRIRAYISIHEVFNMLADVSMGVSN